MTSVSTTPFREYTSPPPLKFLRKDFRNGPHPADWDPTKWIIWLLHRYTSLAPSIARTPDSAIVTAKARVHMAEADRLYSSVPDDDKIRRLEELPVWSRAEVIARHGERFDGRRRVFIHLEGCIVDVGGYIEDHVSVFYKHVLTCSLEVYHSS